MIKEQLMAVKNYKSSTIVEKMQKQQKCLPSLPLQNPTYVQGKKWVFSFTVTSIPPELTTDTLVCTLSELLCTYRYVSNRSYLQKKDTFLKNCELFCSQNFQQYIIIIWSFHWILNYAPKSQSSILFHFSSLIFWSRLFPVFYRWENCGTKRYKITCPKFLSRQWSWDLSSGLPDHQSPSP